MILGYLGFGTGMLIMWLWLTQGSPTARKIKKEDPGVDVLCHHCGCMYRTTYNNVRTANYCGSCQ